MDDHVFERFTGQRDTLIIWDYTDLSTPLPLDERPIDLIAWSMGVWAATQTCPTEHLTSATAINGTPWPIDETRGIPPAIFDGTLSTYSESGLARFRKRMCGGVGATNDFLQYAPQRTTEDLGTELAALGEAIRSRPPKTFPWTRAVGCTADRIFPITAQKAAFPDLIERPGAHWEPTLFEALLKGASL
jgi:hypothetical protein